MRRKSRIGWCICLILLLLGAGCQQAGKKPLPEQNMKSLSASDMRIMASRFSTLAEEVEGVMTATVIVDKADAIQSTGKTSETRDIVAMVGLNLSDTSLKGTDREKTIKEMVRKKILDSDKRVTEVLVTTDANTVKKIKDVAAGVISGKATKSYAKDVNELNKILKKQ